MQSLGDIIKKYRLDNDLSLREFSKKCGLSHTYIDKLEKGVDPRSQKPVEPTLDALEKISTAINLSLDELLTMLGKINSDNKVILNDQEKDVEQLLEETMSQILDQKGLMLNGQIVDDNDLVLLRNAIRNGIELAKTMQKSKK
ncbi:helix-turn-helix domain-containing protein [Paraclostridium sordellii]|uniref:helix-turn-helix domain-containing protein n=1 Tax=Paraclostridium sordellii TaxID=1505 RepID=UPI0005E7074B|nr:helix-turn-helix transcriptional regulator [Paeniclostridium sordellii]AUN14076.1 transcriptional regulator [Paeniclostridium sordellii]MDU5020587.1 helix-turn-helix transcriptional regulator [Clostridiales bacterium]CEP83953.1 immunity repressor protein [[Clostridium] sordellii] [Paeniclostridium sordellii]DAK99017.1 MAG TPA: helix-turn-helix domain protein [Caudoviricetes sp.]